MLNIAENQIFNNQFTAAYNTIADLTFDYPLSGSELTETEDFYDYIVLREGYHQMDKTIYDLDSLEVEELLIFAQLHTGRAKVLANNILCYIYNICIEEEESEKSGRTGNVLHRISTQGQWVWDTRNMPAGSYVYAVFQGSTMLESGKVIVR